MPDENLIKLQHFFEADLRIKKEIKNMTPPTDDEFIDELGISKYTDDVEDSLLYVFSELKRVTSELFGTDSSVMERINILEKSIKNSFASCGYDIYKLRAFYKNCIGNMGLDFINSVKDECIGYAFRGMSSVNKAMTINEILHYMHSAIMNNERLLQSIPEIGYKENDYKYSITLRGKKVPIFEQLFELFPNDLDVGWTDMVILNERKLLMMVRDRGHALTIEITLDNEKARLEYFIPKICNVDMVNKLPGVNRVKDSSIGTTGAMEVPVNDLASSLFDFISKVPMDSDSIYKPMFK